MRLTAREKEWNRMIWEEQDFLERGSAKKETKLNQFLAEKLPDKLQDTLDSAFAKAFETIFEKGTAIIDKTYKKDDLEYQYQVNAYAVELKANSERKQVLPTIRICFLPAWKASAWALWASVFRIFLYS